MERPDLDTLACVNAECQLFRHTGHGNLVVRKTYGRDELRLLRCRRCGEAFFERRGTALSPPAFPARPSRGPGARKPLTSPITHPDLHVQTAQSCATPCCEPLSQAAAACWGSRRRCEQAAATGGGRENASGALSGVALRKGRR
jgi:hypothetical protein